MIIGLASYLKWQVDHPIINVLITEVPTRREDIKVQGPQIDIVGKYVDPSPAIESKVNDIIMQHHYFCLNIKKQI